MRPIIEFLKDVIFDSDCRRNLREEALDFYAQQYTAIAAGFVRL